MPDVVIQVDSLSKRYRLGIVGSKTLHHDFERWWARVRGKPDPYLKIGQEKRQNTLPANRANRHESSAPISVISGQNAFPDDPDHIWALRDVSFEVKQGEVLGIIGRNGAGKSTLLKILSRVTAPTTGEVRVKGRIASLLEVGTGFHPELTGRENIFLNGAILGMTKAEIRRKFDEIVAFSEVAKFIDTPVKRYSSGMYVRLAFAVAAHLDPEILIVDEVLAVGDAEFQKKCLGKMGAVAAGGRTVLFVSHNMGAVSSLCTRCILLRQGSVAGDDRTDSVVAMYLQASAEKLAIPLAQRVDRSGNGTVRFVDCTLSRSADGPAVADLFLRDDLWISLRLEAGRPTNVWVGATITDSLGNKLMHTSNRAQGLAPLRVEGVGTAVLHVPSSPFVDGSYSLSLHATDADTLQACDNITAAAVFQVHPTDLYKTGNRIGSYFGTVHAPHEWLVGDLRRPRRDESCLSEPDR